EKVNLIGRPDLLILPATQFGPLVGEASGTFPELCWLNPWTPLISEEGLRRLSPFGLDLKCVPTQIAFPAGLRYLEPSLRALGRLADGMKCVCSVCQRQRGRMPDRLRLELDTPTPDLFRVANFPTLIVATERFVALAAEHDIRGFVACEIESIQPSR
ncbi:MAG: hypothetical protein KC910_21355, partial [Candidatus Eremiobacteraeota bacterium]|nr:hypothetical protein [Candidatus Eremiobacteraeota bacterium]